MTDEKNPEFMFNTTTSSLLALIVNKKIDPVVLARKALADRGLDDCGIWVGFETARLEYQLWLSQYNR